MSNRNFRIIAICFLFMCFIACKKDYPDDIPDWVKDKIKENKKELVVKDYCQYYECLSIYEYQEPSYGTIYLFVYAPPIRGYYDYYGNYICTPPVCDYSCCDSSFKPEFKRIIYTYKLTN